MSILHWVKFLIKGWIKNDQKEGLFNRLKNIEDKKEEQLKLLSNTNKTSSYIRDESDYNYDNNFALYKFYRALNEFKNRNTTS